ncbi:MAG: hypothetical protein C0467_31300 [Planctomycetaceae bacterium]|nr:hypothetical protein [Planctomycetaceae bacterium]
MSAANQIGDAIVSALSALGWKVSADPGADDMPVARRKTPSLPSGKEPPAVVVVVGEEGNVEYLTARKYLVSYPVAVVYITAGGKLLGDDTTLRDRRIVIRNTIDKKSCFTSVTGFDSSSYGGRAPFNTNALNKDLNYSVQVFTISVQEDRP